MKTKTKAKKSGDSQCKKLNLCNYHSDSLGWDDCSDSNSQCQVDEARKREKQIKKAITNRLAEKGISKDWMKNNLLIIC
jgi:hypothetical protein